MRPAKAKRRKARRSSPMLTERPALTLWGIPVVVNPHIREGLILVASQTFKDLLTIVTDDPRPTRRSRG